MQQPDAITKPMFSVDQVLDFAAEIYGFNITQHKVLDSYADFNVHIFVSSVRDNDHVTRLCEHGYTLKIINSHDSQKPKFFEGQMAMMKHLNSRGLIASKPVRQRSGAALCYITDHADKRLTGIPTNDLPYESRAGENGFLLFCLEYIPGIIVKVIPYTSLLMFKSGIYLGNMCTALQGFHHEGYANVKSSIWYMNNAGEALLDYTFEIKDQTNRELAEKAFHLMQAKVLDHVDEFQHCLVHGDYNEANILATMSEDGDYDISAVIDFGNSHFDAIVFEISLWMTYIFLLSRSSSLELAGHALAGFLLRFKLKPREMEVLRVVMAARMAQSLSIGALMYLKQPVANEYILTTAHCWPKFHDFWNMPKTEMLNCWKAVLESYDLNFLSRIELL